MASVNIFMMANKSGPQTSPRFGVLFSLLFCRSSSSKAQHEEIDDHSVSEDLKRGFWPTMIQVQSRPRQNILINCKNLSGYIIRQSIFIFCPCSQGHAGI